MDPSRVSAMVALGRRGHQRNGEPVETSRGTRASRRGRSLALGGLFVATRQERRSPGSTGHRESSRPGAYWCLDNPRRSGSIGGQTRGMWSIPRPCPGPDPQRSIRPVAPSPPWLGPEEVAGGDRHPTVVERHPQLADAYFGHRSSDEGRLSGRGGVHESSREPAPDRLPSEAGASRSTSIWARSGWQSPSCRKSYGASRASWRRSFSWAGLCDGWES